MKKSVLEKISEREKIISFQLKRLNKTFSQEDFYLHECIETYLDQYCMHYKLQCEEILSRYMSFISQYEKDLKNYVLTGKYPYQIDKTSRYVPDRITYDLFLIITALVTRHRFEIMTNISNLDLNKKRCLIIGVGAGLELLLINNADITAYDSTISDFVKNRFYKYKLNERTFSYDCCCQDQFDTVIAIEILEHIDDPLAMIDGLKKIIPCKGQLVFTTATNVPQFDHLYNFSNRKYFENILSKRGFKIIKRKVIKHHYILSKTESNNVFYILESE